MTETAATGFQARADVGLTPPRTSRGLVVRPRLHRILEEGMRRRLTLVSAPPGYGKSVLLSAWIESRAGGGRPARLVLTRSANDPRLFWRGLADAVADVTGGAAPECDADDTMLAAAVVAAATDGAGPLVIVLDDFQEVRNEAILEPLEQLLQHAPDPLRLVIASRRDPGLGLHRLRLYGDLTELRACDLAFTRDEAEELLAVSGVPVEPEHAEILVERTGGWAAALRFVAISMAPGGDVGSFVDAFDRSEHAVSDYLIREVLVRQEPELRDFLLRGAVCDRMCGALADALTGRTDGAATLAALERDNVFVSSQPERGWYRFHPLFHELLRAEALFDLGAELGSVHAAAAQWLAANDAPLTALGHAVAAGDAELADELLGAVWIGLVGSGEIRRAGDLLRGLGPEAVRRNPQLCLLKAWERLLDGDLAECDAWVRFGAESAAGLEPEALHGWELGRSLVSLERSGLAGDLEAAEKAIGGLTRPAALLVSGADNERRRALILCARGALALWRADLDLALTTLEQALDAARRARLEDCELDALARLALLHAVRGDLKRASRLASLATAHAHRDHGRRERSPRLVPALIALAVCAYEWDDVAGSADHARKAAEIALASADAPGRLAALVVPAAEALRGNGDGVEDVRHQIDRALDAFPDGEPPLLAASLTALTIRLALAEQDLDGAAALAAAGDSAFQAELLVSRARVDLAYGRAEQAALGLAPVLAGSAPRLHGRTGIEAAALAAVATDLAGGDDETTLPLLERALELAEREGMRGPLLDAGPSLAPLLRRAIRRGTAHRWLAAELLSRIEGRTGEPAIMRELLDPLSEKELVVLRYLPTMMSNQEIAGELFVSINTIKTHLKSIYRKLGAARRRDAVRHARELRLIA